MLNFLNLMTALWFYKRTFLFFKKCVLRYLEVKNHDISNLSSNDLVYVWREKANVAKWQNIRKEYKGFNVPLLQFFDKYKIFKFKKRYNKSKT